ncbi:type IV pilus assembly protein FimV, partial [Aromatoleum diolicum]
MTKQLRLTTAHSASFILTAMLILSPARASAAVLGEPTVLSPIGEPLRIEIPLLGGDLARAGDCLRLVSDHPRDSMPWVRGARISIIGRGTNARVVVSHPAPSFEPVLKLGIEDICESRLRREYTLLLSFPSEVATQTAPAANGKARSEDDIVQPP